MAPRRLQALLVLVPVWVGAACRPTVTGSPPSVAAVAQAVPAVAGEALFPGHLLVELTPGVSLDELRDGSPAATPAAIGAGPEEGAGYRLGGVPLRLIRPIVDEAAAGGAIHLFELDREGLPPADLAATGEALARVSRDARVRRCEGDHIRHLAAAPDDPLYPMQWNLRAVRAPQAWQISQGSESVVVAVLDTGIVSGPGGGHPDLMARLVPGYDFISTPESADDGDNRRDPDPTDTGTVDSSRFHGTHVTGIIGAVTNNHLGIAGVDRRCRLMPVRVLGVRGGDGLDSDIADAVRWASGLQVGKLPPPSRPADVLNLSFGGPTTSFTLQRAMDEAVAHGALIVAAAGNGGVDARTYSPGGLDGVISVGASGSDGARADYSNFGPRVDLLAPGGDDQANDAGELTGILSTYRDDGELGNPAMSPYTYAQLSGTSQAAPHVAGAAALVRAVWPAVRQPALAYLLAHSADPKGRCDRDPQGGCGAGLLDIEALLKLAGDQARCGCAGDTVCIDGGACAAPPPLHDPLIPDNTVHGGWCQLAGPGVRGAGWQAWALLLAGLWVGIRGRRRRWQRERACRRTM